MGEVINTLFKRIIYRVLHHFTRWAILYYWYVSLFAGLLNITFGS